MAPLIICFAASVTFLLISDVSSATDRTRRELPLSYDCNPNQQGSCYKGDLISQSLADCNRDAAWYNLYTCNPLNDLSLSSVVDLPDVDRHGVDCVADRSRPIICGASGTNTRCVCDKAVDYKRPKETVFHQCRCQYWPDVDIRQDLPSYCTQFDHGGTSGIHFYTCCNNCNESDTDSSCDGETYQGGGSGGARYCGNCGQNSQLGGGRITYRFNCVSCNQQRACERKCNDEFFGLTEITPGLCPRWSGCFRGCCVKAEQLANNRNRGKRQTQNTAIDVGDFCGDFICQRDENYKTCPADCCPLVNPTNCSTNSCNTDCCYHPKCCGFNSESLAQSNHCNQMYITILLVYAVGILID